MTPGERARAFVDEVLIPREVDAELGRLTDADAADADPRLLLLRRLDPPRRQRDRAQRPQRRDGGVGGRNVAA